MSAFQRLTHVGLCVSDLARSRRFYEEGLGFSFEHELTVTGEPTDTLLRLRGTDLRAIYLTRDGVRIELLYFASPAAPPARTRVMNERGLTHLSFRVADIDALVRPIAQGDCDIVLGSRFLGRAVNLPSGRRRLLRMAILFTRIVNRVDVTDAHNGLRAFSRRAAQQIRITLDRMAHATEIIDLIRLTGLPYREVPVEIHYTDYSLAKGQSSRNAIRIATQYLLHRLFR